MKKWILCLLVFTTVTSNLNSQYADLGTGTLKNQIWWFDWNGFTISNGASRTFTTGDGMDVTIIFSAVQGPVFYPYVMNTWSGAVLHFLYDFSNPAIKPALFSPYTTFSSHFNISVTATRNGLPTPFKFIAADAEGSAFGETTTLITNGSNWKCIDFFRNSSQNTNPFAGCNTQTAVITDTYGGSSGIGQNPVVATDAPASGPLTMSCDFNRAGVEGQMAIAFGIFGSVDMGDLPPSYGIAQHALAYTTTNPCNYLPPLPSTTLVQNLKIGNIPGDADPVQTSDDNVNGADEDGISTFPPYNGSGVYSLSIPVTNTTGNMAYLGGAFDINRNGTFESNEFVGSFVPNNATSVPLTWTGLPAILPPGSVNGWAFRLRLSTDQIATQNPSGYAPDGEVEDYLTNFLQTTTANFLIPDTVCVNTPVNITNTSTNATSYYWNFCVANVNSTPGATNLGNIGGQFQLPVFIDYVQYNGNWYGFMTNNTPGKLTRLDFGNSLLNTPTAVNLGNVGGTINDAAEGIQVVFNEGKWYAIIVGGNNNTGGSRIMKIDFGPNLTNTTPTGTNWGNIGGMNYPGDLHLFNDNGNWYAFTVDQGNSVIRFSFGTSFQNPPTAVNFGNVGGTINGSDGIYVINDNGNWYAFVSCRGNSSIVRLNFGNSLLNVPTATSLGNPNNTLNLPRDIYVMKFCNELVGFVVNEGSNDLVKLNFSSITSVPTAISMGNVGNLSFPHSISKLFRVGPDLYSFIPNVNNNTLTRINFSGCNNSSIPNYSGANPPPITYATPGVYNINLTIDDGLPTQASICKQVVVHTCTREISGIVNDYTEVLGLDPCTNKLTVGDASAYHVGDTVLLIQMKGAIIDSSNTSSFGTIIDYRGAGNYEFNYIKSISGNEIELKNFLLRQYDIPDGRVQLIRVPYYDNVSINSTLTCLPWDGRKGGVVAINVQNTLQLNAFIDVTGKGFRGGIDPVSNPASMNCNEAQYYYPVDPDLASGKGEGITELSAAKSFGRGAMGNGGGGGNSHNSGGGGGSNSANGGFGGYNYELAPCTNAPFDNRGMPGKPLTYSNAANKIFMGGGGGAGHTNNPEGFQALGGNGSGIIILSANTLDGNGWLLKAFGNSAPGCSGLGVTGCHEGMGGGGAGGTILLNVDSYINDLGWNIKGGQGANMNVGGYGRLGPGGGASGGITWYKLPSTPPNIVAQALSGGGSGVNTQYGNDPWGSTGGDAGTQLFDLQLPISTIPFKANIDSVRIKDTLTACRSFDLKGLGFTNTYPVIDWHWYFGDGNTANTQNTIHTYTGQGAYTIKLVVTDINGCRDSITKDVATIAANPDFSYHINTCDPLTVQFNAAGSDTQNPYWSFGDATILQGQLNPVHTYASQNDYTTKYSASNGVCSDTITKTISLAIVPDDIIITHDTTICPGAVKQLLTKPALSFCWTPITYLSDPNSPNPITSTPQNITYYYTAEVTGNNLIVNGDFSQGNTGFSSGYNNNTINTTEGQYAILPNPSAWNNGLVNCGDHTTGTGNMMVVNGAPATDVNVWTETITVLPNTNYAFSTWIQALIAVNPAQLQFSINGKNIGGLINASTPPCTWTQFFTNWNSGNNTSAAISIVNKNTVLNGNDFALDDISFAPVFIKRDSVIITVDNPSVKTNNDTTICPGTTVQLNATGSTSYSWSPSTSLNDASSPNPLATPVTTTEYIVSGTSVSGCVAKDSVTITVYSKPSIVKSGDTTICKNSSVQLSVNGGINYQWTPSNTLNDPTSPNPVASPIGLTTYYVLVTDAHTCNNIDSIKVGIRPDPVFAINAPVTICKDQPAQLTASGGDLYQWQTDPSLNNTTIANPVAAPPSTTVYSVLVTETACNNSATLNTTVNVNPLPDVHATKSNDLDCSNDRSQLTASGARTYTWIPASSLNNPSISNPMATPFVKTMYIVKGTDMNGCANSDSVLVDFLATNASGYFMPSAFTPNHDGLNDCYGIRYWGVIQELEFSIYNRWGERIFFTKNPADCWDGTYKGVMQDPAVFVYMIKAKTICGSTFRKGTFTLVR